MSRERVFEGESADGRLQEALETALRRLGEELGADGVRDAMASWRLVDISGAYGGLAGFRGVKAKIAAARTPEWGSA
jgi:hypothetical protein